MDVELNNGKNVIVAKGKYQHKELLYKCFIEYMASEIDIIELSKILINVGSHYEGTDVNGNLWRAYQFSNN